LILIFGGSISEKQNQKIAAFGSSYRGYVVSELVVLI
jgi:hypothetical protein